MATYSNTELQNFRDFINFKKVLFLLCYKFGKTLFFVSIVCLSQKFHINRIVEHIAFCTLLVSLSRVFSVHGVACFTTSFFLWVSYTSPYKTMFQMVYFVHLVIQTNGFVVLCGTNAYVHEYFIIFILLKIDFSIHYILYPNFGVLAIWNGTYEFYVLTINETKIQ